MGLHEGGLYLREYNQYEDEEQRQDADVHGAGEAAPHHAFRRFSQFFGYQESDQQYDTYQGQRGTVGLCRDGGYGCGNSRYHFSFPNVSWVKKLPIAGNFINVNTIGLKPQSVNRPFYLTTTLQIWVNGR
jgi:hypothetical protein